MTEKDLTGQTGAEQQNGTPLMYAHTDKGITVKASCRDIHFEITVAEITVLILLFVVCRIFGSSVTRGRNSYQDVI